jgi:hypothetical protein
MWCTSILWLFLVPSKIKCLQLHGKNLKYTSFNHHLFNFFSTMHSIHQRTEVALKQFRSSMCPFLHFEGDSGTKSLKNIGYVIIYLKLLFKPVKYTVIFCQLKLILTSANPIILMQALKRTIEVSSFYCFFL